MQQIKHKNVVNGINHKILRKKGTNEHFFQNKTKVKSPTL